jgi:uncharacterized membrane protein
VIRKDAATMAAEHEDHGNTPAAWTTVIMLIIGSTVIGVGMMLANIPVVIGGVVVCVVGVIAGKLLAMAGFGKQVSDAEPAPTEASA